LRYYKHPLAPSFNNWGGAKSYCIQDIEIKDGKRSQSELYKGKIDVKIPRDRSRCPKLLLLQKEAVAG